ncbi:thiamine diphosphate-binding protein [Dactylonectria macrodidyma]|uniref:Pyruvate decarboxylase n=1 Tax=Dactylonectria macrodidyma TaxID=307937 RepID=A0A9P9ER72_9HYPO|nr:thiamine diphosphate-binding protein [Dactylonectria macrodidyma]
MNILSGLIRHSRINSQLSLTLLRPFHSKMAPTVDLAEYLWIRLAQLGLRSVHGVPGDYNLTVLDYLESTGINWVGNANELNSGYAADGYARIKGIGALVTSFGVGELSAINAIGGAYAEKAPVVHIVGTPPVAAQQAGACLHHSLGDGNFRVFANMYQSVTVAQANLVDGSSAPQMIDATLKECLRQSRPVYIEIPSDMVKVKVPTPTSPIDLSIPEYDEPFENEVVEALATRIQRSEKPMMLLDAFTARFGIKDEVNQLAKLTGIPILTSPGGKGVVSEHLPNFHGVHFGSAGKPAHQAWAKSRDLVLRFGPLNSETNTFGFTALPDPRVTVTFDKHFIHWEGQHADGRAISIKSALQKLLRRLKFAQLPIPEPYPSECPSLRAMLEKLPEPKDGAIVDQYSFWLLISNYIREGDIVMTETGTASYGGQSLLLPDDTAVINSTIWLSIGYMLAAAQGASLAQREMCQEGTRPSGRTILFEGDGSLQMTAQAISDMIRNKLDVTIFVLNNNGYTIERIIHGFNENYNDVQPWRNLEAVSYFGAPKDDPSYPVRTFLAQNWGELRTILQNPELQVGKGLNMVEVRMEMADAPQSLVSFVQYLIKRNKGEV